MTNLREKQNHAERKKKRKHRKETECETKGHKKQPDKIELLCAFRMNINFSKSNHQPISKKDK